MEKRLLTEQMHAYGQWKSELIKNIERYQGWLEENEMGTPEDELQIYEILGQLRSDKLTIAFVAEFARGKTELINAIFFSEYDRRLLPSEAGRTTMCPTELLYDSNEDHAYIRLLSIETRLSDIPIAEYKQDPINWTSMELDLENPDSMAESFQEIVRTKMVSIADAKQLGLYTDEDEKIHAKNGNAPSEIEVPMWRHAIISFPHPLLKQGLVILDTPGLNALGSEPELTLNMLPNAQAVLFIIAADTGVTKSDLDMWAINIKPLRKNTGGKGLVVVLNKVDTLWDELKSSDQVDKVIQKQCEEAATTLGIGTEMVIPCSAQKGLLAKIRHDQELIERSNIHRLERILANDIIPSQQDLVREHVKSAIGAMVKESHGLLRTKLTSTKGQLDELAGLSGKNTQVIEHLMSKTREEQVDYHKNLESFNSNKKLLSQHSKELLARLSLTKLDKLVSKSRHSMSESWTTGGLKKGMKTFFDGVNEMFEEVDDYSDQMNRLVTTLYRKFHVEHNIPEIEPILYDPKPYLDELLKLNDEAEEFRNSPVTTLTEQSFVIKKFFISLVSHARNIFFKAHRDAEKWHKSALSPLVKQIKERKSDMEKRLDNLRKASQSGETIQTQVDELKKIGMAQKKQFDDVTAIYKAINK
ncbi:MAG: dynamin family protein [Gammaproteobacteria bacterium]|nr:dynamin family protein [Gammaproteobacteria bacterium]